MLWGETGETFDGSSCASSNITAFLNWADAHVVGYEAWTWDTWGTCGALINDYAGHPHGRYGAFVKSYYAHVAAGTHGPRR